MKSFFSVRRSVLSDRVDTRIVNIELNLVGGFELRGVSANLYVWMGGSGAENQRSALSIMNI